MNLTLSFVEYSAVHSVKDLSSTAFALLANAKLGTDGNNKAWMLDGDHEGFDTLLADIKRAKDHYLRLAVSAALSDVARGIETLLRNTQSIGGCSLGGIGSEVVKALDPL